MGFKEDFVAALRSGEYRQTEGVLRDSDDCFCVEGVAVDLAIKGGYVSGCTWVPGEVPGYPYSWYLNECNYGRAYAPDAVSKLLSPPLDSKFSGSVRSLMNLNDLGKSLFELADLVEKHFQNAE